MGPGNTEKQLQMMQDLKASVICATSSYALLIAEQVEKRGLMDKIHLKVLTHEKTVYDGDIDELYVKTKDGQMGILKNHIPFVCTLDIGVAKIIANNICQCLSLVGGILQFSNNYATILTDCAELDCDIDAVRARQARDRAAKRLQDKDESTDIKRAQIALARAQARLNATEKHF